MLLLVKVYIYINGIKIRDVQIFLYNNNLRFGFLLLIITLFNWTFIYSLDELSLYHNKLTKIYSGTYGYNDFRQS